MCTPEVVLVVQARENGVRDPADADLERGAVLDERRDRLADSVLGVRLAGPARPPTGGGRSAVKACTRSSGTTVLPCVLGIRSLISAMMIRAESAAARAASTEVPSVQLPWRSGEREREQRDVERDEPLTEQARNVRQEDRNEIRSSFLDGPAQERPDEQRVRMQPSGHAALRERRGAVRVQVVELDPLQVGSRAGGLEQRGRGGRCAVHEHPVAALQMANGLARAHGPVTPGAIRCTVQLRRARSLGEPVQGILSLTFARSAPFSGRAAGGRRCRAPVRSSPGGRWPRGSARESARAAAAPPLPPRGPRALRRCPTR